MNGELAITASPCADCKCGSLCHWDDLATPPPNDTPAQWAIKAVGIECQRCPCTGYKLAVTKKVGPVGGQRGE